MNSKKTPYPQLLRLMNNIFISFHKKLWLTNATVCITPFLSLLVGLFMAATSPAAEPAAAWVHLSAADGRVIINPPGLAPSAAAATAFLLVDGKHTSISTRRGELIGQIETTSGSTPFGEAEVTSGTFGGKDSALSFTIRLKRLKNLRGFTLQGVVHNRSGDDVTLRHVDLLDQSAGDITSLAADPASWLVTPLMQDTKATSLAETNGSFKEAVLLSQPDGRSLLAGPVGPAEAYCRIEVKGGKLKAYAEMDNVLIRAGESRHTEEMLFCFEPIQTSLSLWTRWVAVTHQARLHRGPVYGWCSWYDRTTKIDEAHVLGVVQTIKDNPNTYGKGIIQIDDGYQKMDGDWSGNEKFPRGMAALAADIREAGCIPGVWFAPLMINPEHPWAKTHPEALQRAAGGLERFMNPNPFHPAGAHWIRPDHPDSKRFLFDIIHDARERGYGYIKIDFNGIGNQFVDPTKTRLQIFRELYTLYREAAGDEMYILSCLGQPTRGVIGFIDAARVGPDSHPAGFPHCLDSVLRFQIYDNVWWQNDPDVSYLDVKLPSRRVGYTPQGEGMWRTWHAVNALVGGTAMISEPLQFDDVKAVARNYEIMRPGSAEPAHLLTLGTSADNSIFGFTANRAYGDFAVYNLYNAEEEKRHINLNFANTGLPRDRRCAVYDFWQDKVIAFTTGSYNSVPLDQYCSALVRITPLSDAGPTLVGSNLHLSMGATEVADLRVSPTAITIDLNPAGAQQGTLTLFSQQPLAASDTSNCQIDKIEPAGEDLYRVHLSGRKWNQPQSVTLTITSPQ